MKCTPRRINYSAGGKVSFQLSLVLAFQFASRLTLVKLARDVTGMICLNVKPQASVDTSDRYSIDASGDEVVVLDRGCTKKQAIKLLKFHNMNPRATDRWNSNMLCCLCIEMNASPEAAVISMFSSRVSGSNVKYLAKQYLHDKTWLCFPFPVNHQWLGPYFWAI